MLLLVVAAVPPLSYLVYTNLYAVTGTEKNEAVAAAATADYERTMWMIGAQHSF